MRSGLQSKLGYVILLTCMIFATGCGREYAGASEQTYKIATALVNICDRKAEDKFEVVETLIDDGVRDGKVSEREAGYLRDIVQQAKDGEWESAEARARQVLSDQVQ